MEKKNGAQGLFLSIGRYFTDFGEAVSKGDIFVKLSTVFMGLGYIKRKKYLKALGVFLIQAAFIYFVIAFASKNLARFGTLGTVEQQVIYNRLTKKNEFNNFDNSFKILLYSIASLAVILGFVLYWFSNVKQNYRMQKMNEAGEHIPTIRENLTAMFESQYHKTLLTVPLLGILLFTIVPLIVMIAVAFTNYDQQHFPPAKLFTWVGRANFRNLFSNSITLTFGYSFRKILGWTLTWAVLATFTNYFLGIALALLINHKRTHFRKFWRTCFVIAMAVPQFVSLLLVRSFFADSGIVNTICANLGITGFLKNIGLVPAYLSYIPFLTHPGWAKFMIVLINIWVGIPYLLLIATGILMNIPADLYEAATIDGAGPFQQFKSITMPYMLFVTGPYLVNSVVSNINNFNVIYLLTNGVYETQNQLLANSHANEVDLLVTWLFRLTNDYYNYKMASVIGILVFIVCAVITLVAFNMIIKGNNEEKMQ